MSPSAKREASSAPRSGCGGRASGWRSSPSSSASPSSGRGWRRTGPPSSSAPPNTRNVDGLLFGTDALVRTCGPGSCTVAARSSSCRLSTLIGLAVGVVVGLVAAYNRGRLDNFLMRCVDILLAFPGLLFLLVAITTLGRNTWVIILLVALTVIPRVARVTGARRSVWSSATSSAAAEALGESRTRILRSEVLPNVAGPLLVEANLRLTYSIFLIATLGFLGLGIGLNRADWAQMINENRLALSHAAVGRRCCRSSPSPC